MLKYSFVISCIFTFLNVLQAQSLQSKGVPKMRTYTPKEYSAAGKVWDIDTSLNGFTYAATDHGLLSYDGQNWDLTSGSKGITRSVMVVNDTLIYTGSDLDFGKWIRQPDQTWQYTSLYPFKENPKEYSEEFWYIFSYENEIIFVSHYNLYALKDGQLTKIAAPNGNRIVSAFEWKSKIYLQEKNNGLYVFNGMSLNPVYENNFDADWVAKGLFEHQNQLYLITQNQGIFTWQNETWTSINLSINSKIQGQHVFDATSVGNDYVALGTVLNGVFVIHKNGEIIQHVNKRKGLPNNTILSLHYNTSGNLWAATDYGLAQIFVTQPVGYFYDYQGEFGTAATAYLHQNNFFLGTNQGLYTLPWEQLNNDQENTDYTLVPGSQGQVWTLNYVYNQLLAGHDKGLLSVSENQVAVIDDIPGVWDIQPFRENYLLTGNYNGVNVYQYKNGTFEFLKKLDNIVGSCHQVLVENDQTLWVDVHNYALLKLQLDQEFSVVKTSTYSYEPFESQTVKLSLQNGEIYAHDASHTFLYDKTKDEFVKQNNQTQTHRIPLDSVYSFEVVPNGFALANDTLTAYQPQNPASLLVTKVMGFNNESQMRFSTQNPTISHDFNNVKIHFSLPQSFQTQYRFKLKNHKNTWSEWSETPYTELLNLSGGNYTLLLEAKGQNGQIQTTEFSFCVSSAWYQTIYAYLGYVLLLVLLGYVLWKWQNARLLKQKREMLKKEQNSLRKQAEKYKQQKLLEKQKALEQEQVELKNKIKNKTVALTKKAKENEDKNRILTKLREGLEEIDQKPSVGKRKVIEMKRLIDNYLKTDDNTFEIQMDELHQEYFKALKTKFPDLSIYDLRLCVYLKMGLKSKEIAQIQGVLPSSINVSRSRLRKKLDLLPEQDLYDFLNSIEP